MPRRLIFRDAISDDSLSDRVAAPLARGGSRAGQVAARWRLALSFSFRAPLVVKIKALLIVARGVRLLAHSVRFDTLRRDLRGEYRRAAP